jgi:hypothetical protein
MICRNNDMNTVTRCLSFLLAVGLLFAWNTAPAVDINTVINGDERISFIQKEFDDSAMYSSIWWYGWMGVFGASAAVSFGVGLTSDDETVKITQVVSGVQSVIGFTGLILSPMPSVYAGGRLSRMPDGTQEEKIRKLLEGERLLSETADAQAFGSSWVPHLLNFAVGAAGGLIIWKAYGNEIEDSGGNPRKEALYNFLLSFVIGELQIFSQPTSGIKAWNSYRGMYAPDSSTYYFIVPAYDGLLAGGAVMF